jgi:uncharacterized repeat protein (TIGR01451 family)
MLPRRLFSARTAAIVFANLILVSCAQDLVAPSTASAPPGTNALQSGGVASGADLQISGSASTGSPNAGAAFSYTFQIKNSGPDAATDAMFVDTLPAGTGFNYATGNGVVFPCSTSNMVVTCALGTIEKGSQSLVVVNLDAPVTAGSFTNTGRAASSSADPQPSNNAVTVTVQVKKALAACSLPAGQSTYDGLVMFGATDGFSAIESFEYQATNGVAYWVETNYFDGNAPLTTVINLDCKTSPAQFVQVGNFVNVTGIVSGTIVLPGTATPIPILHASVIQVLTHKDAGF